MFKSAASPASTLRPSKVRDISNCAKHESGDARRRYFSDRTRQLRWRISLPRIGRLAGTLATDRPKSPWAWGRRSAITVAGPVWSYGRFGGFDDRAHPARILPPA